MTEEGRPQEDNELPPQDSLVPSDSAEQIIQAGEGVPVEAPKSRQFQLEYCRTQFSSPYPPPELLQAYEAACPGLPKQIIKAVDGEVHHRRELEKRRLDASITDRKAARFEKCRGQYLGFGIGIAGLIASVWIAYMGYPATAGTIGVTTVVSLVSVFVLGRRTDNQPTKERKKTSQTSGKFDKSKHQKKSRPSIP